MKNLILILILVVLVGGAFYFIYKSKKRGEHCIGCPYAKTCERSKCGGCTAQKTEK